MKKLTLIISLYLLGAAFCVNAQEITQTTQSWSGYLKPTVKDSIKIVINLQFEDERLTGVTMDSPDQMAYDIKATKFSMQNDTFHFAILNAGITYKGVIEEQLISGTFTQGGKKLPLLLQPSQPVLPPNRPQTPQPPFPYVEEEINMNDHNGEPNITGTLTLPKDGKIKATLILITGSGWQDRDETIFFHKPFKVIADFLTRNGYAVYRYDDLPANVFAKSTTFDFEKNVQTIVKYFQQDKRTKSQPVGLLGHSEGGSVAFMAAANNPSIDFIISLAGPGEKFNAVNLYQIEEISKEQGLNDKEIEDVLELQRKFNQLVENAKTTTDANDKLKNLVAEYNKKWNDEQKSKYNFTAKSVLGMVQLIYNPWFFNLFKIDFVKYIKKIKSPVYAANGEKDLQIYYKTNLAIIDQNLPKKTPRKIVSYPNLNHLFQTCETGSLEEYGEIEETIYPKVLDDILLWLNEVVH